jgi:hypothetical protein
MKTIAIQTPSGTIEIKPAERQGTVKLIGTPSSINNLVEEFPALETANAWPGGIRASAEITAQVIGHIILMTGENFTEN